MNLSSRSNIMVKVYPLRSWTTATLFIVIALAVILLSAAPTLLAQDSSIPNLRLTCASANSLSFAWDPLAGETAYDLAWFLNSDPAIDGGSLGGVTSPLAYTLTGLTRPGEGYYVSVSGRDTTVLTTMVFNTADASVTKVCTHVAASKKKKARVTPTPTPRPPANTCPNLLPDIIVSGYVSYASQCQVVMGAGVGRQDLLDRGVIAAVDIWSLVPDTGVEVCFRNLGAEVVFLDAAYSPRLLSTLEHTVRDGMTCAAINTTGTVVLLAS